MRNRLCKVLSRVFLILAAPFWFIEGVIIGICGVIRGKTYDELLEMINKRFS